MRSAPDDPANASAHKADGVSGTLQGQAAEGSVSCPACSGLSLTWIPFRSCLHRGGTPPALSRVTGDEVLGNGHRPHLLPVVEAVELLDAPLQRLLEPRVDRICPRAPRRR